MWTKQQCLSSSLEDEIIELNYGEQPHEGCNDQGRFRDLKQGTHNEE